MKCEKCGKRQATHCHYKYWKEKPLPPKSNHRLIAKKHPDWFQDVCALCHAKIHGTSPKQSELKYWVVLRDRAIKTRNIVRNQIRDFRNIEFQVPKSWETKLDDWNKEIKEFEKEIKKLLRTGNYPIWHWLEKIKGINYNTAGKLITHIDIKNSPMISSLWRYCGLDANYMWRKNKISQEESKKYGKPYLKKELLGVLADNFIKQRTPKYRNIYDKTKEKQLEKKLTKNHSHRYAIRKMIKEFLKDMWIEWRKIEGLSISEPY